MLLSRTKCFARISVFLLCMLFLGIAAAKASETKRILIYGDSNTFGWITRADGTFGRLPLDQTWAGKTAELLGNGYDVIIEGLGGRTTNIDCAPNSGSGYIPGAGMNGAAYLPAALSSHMPLDLVVIMLGTNDLNAKHNRSAEETAKGVDELVKIVKNGEWQKHTTFKTPQVLVLAPPKLDLKQSKYKAMFAGAFEKSAQLAGLYQKVAEDNHAEFFDVASVVPFAEANDEIHLSVKNHSDLANALAPKIKALFKDETAPQK